MNKKLVSTIFLILGLVALTIGISIDNKAFSYAAIVFIFISLITGGRWMRPRRK